MRRMHYDNIQKLFAAMEANRVRHQEYLLQLQQSAFTFKTGLQMVKGKLELAAEQYTEIIQQQPHYLRKEAKILQMHRRAS